MQIKDLTITRVYKGQKETKYGVKPTVAIKTTEYGDKWLSTFKVKPVMDSWKEGDKVTLDVEETEKFINFKLPEANGSWDEARIRRLEKAVFGEEEPSVQAGEQMEVEPKGMDDFDF